MNDIVLCQFDHNTLDAFWASLFTALFCAAGWAVSRMLNRLEERHKRAEDKFTQHDEALAECDKRITVLETKTGSRMERY
jgi:hypothetical protein